MRFVRLICVPFLLLAGHPAAAAELAGIVVPEVVTAADGTRLALNGTGLRKRAFFRIYVIALYLPKKTRDPGEVLGLAGAKRVSIRMLRDVGANQFIEALNEGLRDNNGADALRLLEPRLAEFGALVRAVGEAREGMQIELEWQPAAGTLVSVDGKPQGRPIAGEDFYRALLRIWLGDKPAQTDIRQGLLGGA
jgi:hypothetical protein